MESRAVLENNFILFHRNLTEQLFQAHHNTIQAKMNGEVARKHAEDAEQMKNKAHAMHELAEKRLFKAEESLTKLQHLHHCEPILDQHQFNQSCLNIYVFQRTDENAFGSICRHPLGPVKNDVHNVVLDTSSRASLSSCSSPNNQNHIPIDNPSAPLSHKINQGLPEQNTNSISIRTATQGICGSLDKGSAEDRNAFDVSVETSQKAYVLHARNTHENNIDSTKVSTEESNHIKMSCLRRVFNQVLDRLKKYFFAGKCK